MTRKLQQKTKSQKGFTLAELLFVVAIISVLMAISVPVFNSQLEKSRDATDQANLRAAYSEAVAAYMAGDNITDVTAAGYTFQKSEDGKTYTFTKTIDKKGTNDKFGKGESSDSFKIGNKEISSIPADSGPTTLEITFDENGDLKQVDWKSGDATNPPT